MIAVINTILLVLFFNFNIIHNEINNIPPKITGIIGLNLEPQNVNKIRIINDVKNINKTFFFFIKIVYFSENNKIPRILKLSYLSLFFGSSNILPLT